MIRIALTGPFRSAQGLGVLKKMNNQYDLPASHYRIHHYLRLLDVLWPTTCL